MQIQMREQYILCMDVHVCEVCMLLAHTRSAKYDLPQLPTKVGSKYSRTVADDCKPDKREIGGKNNLKRS